MTLYFYTKNKEVAATSLADLQALIVALDNPGTAANASTIARVTGKVESLVQSDSGEVMTCYFYDDASTAAAFVTDAAVTVTAGLGDPDPSSNNNYISPTALTISGSTRAGTLALNTPALQTALRNKLTGLFFGRCLQGSAQFVLQIRKTTAGVTDTVALLEMQVVPGVLAT